MAETEPYKSVTVVECRPNMVRLSLDVKVVSCSIISEVGKKKVVECLVGDSSGCILLKARGKESDEFRADRSLRINGCKVDMYHGSMRLICEADATFEECGAVSVKKDNNMSLLEFESVVVSAYAPKAEVATGETVTEAAAAQSPVQDVEAEASPSLAPVLDADAFPAISEPIAG